MGLNKGEAKNALTRAVFLNRLDDNGASFVMRAYTTINPLVVQAFDGQGRRRQQSIVLRVIVSWKPGRKAPCFIVTNLDRSRYSADTVVRLVQLRWQIELLFKEYK